MQLAHVERAHDATSLQELHSFELTSSIRSFKLLQKKLSFYENQITRGEAAVLSKSVKDFLLLLLLLLL